MMRSMARRRRLFPARSLLPAVTIALLLLLSAAFAQRDETEEFPSRFLDHEILAKGQVREVSVRGTVIRLIEGEIGQITVRDFVAPGNQREVLVDLSRARGEVKFEDTDEIVPLNAARLRLADALYVEIARMRGKRTNTRRFRSGTEPRRVPGRRRGPEAEIPPQYNLVVDGWVWIRVLRLR